MKNQKMAVLTAVVAVVAVLIGAFLLISFSKNDRNDLAIDAGVIPTASDNEEKSSYFFAPTQEDFSSFSEESTSLLVSQPDLTQPESTDASTTLPEGETTTLTQMVTNVSQTTNKAFYQIFDMPTAPRYIPPDTDIDFDKASIASYMYNPDGNYYYTNDKDCWQYNFGFNEGYDSMAPLGMIVYDTVRTKFTYNNKEYLVQFWKGQYGYAFVGGEIGLYTRPAGTTGTHFNCARENEWLNMEMCFMWDEYRTGDYKPIFTRDYGKYWWCTGFVVGFDGNQHREQFRLVAHITFENAEMADLFCKAFAANGFKQVSSLSRNNLDCFVQSGADVGFVWQNITH